MKAFASALLLVSLSSACQSTGRNPENGSALETPDTIRSCTVPSGTGSYCLESADASPLAFCGGDASEEPCDPDDFDQTCKKTIKIGNGAEGDLTTEKGQILNFYMTKDEYGPGVCDTGSLSKL